MLIPHPVAGYRERGQTKPRWWVLKCAGGGGKSRRGLPTLSLARWFPSRTRYGTANAGKLLD